MNSLNSYSKSDRGRRLNLESERALAQKTSTFHLAVVCASLNIMLARFTLSDLQRVKLHLYRRPRERLAIPASSTQPSPGTPPRPSQQPVCATPCPEDSAAWTRAPMTPREKAGARHEEDRNGHTTTGARAAGGMGGGGGGHDVDRSVGGHSL